MSGPLSSLAFRTKLESNNNNKTRWLFIQSCDSLWLHDALTISDFYLVATLDNYLETTRVHLDAAVLRPLIRTQTAKGRYIFDGILEGGVAPQRPPL